MALAFISISTLGQDLIQIMNSLQGIYPQLLLVGGLLAVIVLDLLKKRTLLPVMSLLAIVGAGILLHSSDQAFSLEEGLFLGMLRPDGLAVFLQTLILVAGFLSILLTFRLKAQTGPQLLQLGEYHALVLSLLLGAMFMSMTTHLLMVYLAIELVSISSYVLTSFRFSKQSAEAGLKYLLFGAVASAVMLYGISLLYGFTGTLDFGSPAFQMSLLSLNVDAIPLLVASFLTLAGFLFKLSVVPFHIWAPDVYEGAPVSVAALFSVAPKLAGIGLLLRFLQYFHESSILFVSVHFDWQMVLAVLAALSMFIGNLAAVWQQDARRMLAYSSIAHTGFLLAGVLTYSALGIRSVLFYGTIYLIMNFAAFLLVKMLWTRSGHYTIKAWSGLGNSFPYLGAALVLVMIALTGLPPTAGFTAKLLVFTALWEGWQQSGNSVLGYLLLAGVVNTIIALFYYLKIPYFMYFKKAEASEALTVPIGKPGVVDQLLLCLLTGLLLLFFLKADWLLNEINKIDIIF